jgi:antitoxin HicB
VKLEDYLKLKYPITLYPETGSFSVEIKHLPGCVSQGDTLEEALEMLEDAKCAWIKANLELGNQIPLPSSEISDRSEIEKSQEIPDSWKRRGSFYFEVTWLTNVIPKEQDGIYGGINQMHSFFDEVTHQYYKNLEEIKEKDNTSDEKFKITMETKGENSWYPYILAKFIPDEPNFEKFYFEVCKSLEFDSYLEFDYAILKQDPSLKFTYPEISDILRDEIKNDLLSNFLENEERKYFKKIYELGKFAIEFKIGATNNVDHIRRKHFEKENPMRSLADRYCYVEFINILNISRNLWKPEPITEGRLEIQDNTIICGNWKYEFEDNSYIYGIAFDEVEFYSSNPKGRFSITVDESEMGTIYEKGERHE